MTVTVGQIGVDVRMNSASLMKDAGKARENIKKFSSGSSKSLIRLQKQAAITGKAFKRMGSNIFSIRGLIASAFGGIALKSLVDYGDRLDKLGLRLGTTAGYLSEMKFVVEQTGVSFETMTMAMQRANRRIAEAALGSGEAKNALKELGLNAQKLNNMSLEDKFYTIADALDGVSNQSDKTRLAMKLFDSEGVALIQTMEGGSAAMKALREDARSLGATMTDVQADNMAKLNDAFGRMSTLVKGAASDMIAFMAPALTKLVNGITNVIGKTREWFGQLTDTSEIAKGYKEDVQNITQALQGNTKESNLNTDAINKNADAIRKNAIEKRRAQIADLKAVAEDIPLASENL